MACCPGKLCFEDTISEIFYLICLFFFKKRNGFRKYEVEAVFMIVTI